MDIKPYDETIKTILSYGCQYSIPRFQREYSWERKNYAEFLDDMISNLVIENGEIKDAPYFLGTMLFIGNYRENSGVEISVVDGQQRLTTITILFSAISDRFRLIGENKLSEKIFEYIMAEDDNGDPIRILKSETHYPFFSYYIQDIEKNEPQHPNSEEEICIKETYEYLYDQLDETKLKASLKRRWGDDLVDGVNYKEILKVLRDQVLNSILVAISTSNRADANMIFEILNAKGKRLTDVDLIKSKR